MTERDFEIGGKKFKLHKIDAFKQFHIVRRIGPILADLLPAVGKLKNLGDSLSESEKFDRFVEIAGPLMEGLSKLSDEDADKVLHGLLSSVESNMTGAWAKLSNGSMLMVQNLDLSVLLQIAGRAFAYNLSGFFNELPRHQSGE